MKKYIIAILLVALTVSTLFASGVKEGEKKVNYPTKPITMIIPYGAGGTTDVSGRKFAAVLQKVIGQPVTVQNMPGASGSIACKYVKDAAPDGYTVLFHAESLGTQRVAGLSDLSYDDFTPIMSVVNDPKVIVVAKDSKYNTLEDLLADMKKNPGKVKMSYTGPGGSGHVQGIIMEKLGYVPALTAYKSGSDCFLAVLSGEVDFTNSNFATVVGYIASGDLKLLAVSSDRHLDKYPDVPTFEEVDPAAAPYMKNAFTPLNFLVANTVDSAIVDVLRDAAKKVVESDEWKSFVADNCLEPLYEKYKTPEEIKKFYSEWTSLVSWLLYDAGAVKNSPSDFGIARPNN
ncbi:MAG: tripartite tricarboxylate transporter substrate binding protein [Sphaerochaetaceae bacterium]|nr:tripartite tricarboxylate transporter substrate binding protein [Sphaerochaetaceae bacterium]